MKKKDLVWGSYRKAKNAYLNGVKIKLRDKETYRLLSKNKELHNRYAGKRCFIIGNGPSVKSQDLSRLADEYVFTVNYSANSTQFKGLRTNFHAWADPNIFRAKKENGEQDYLISAIKAVNTEDNRPIVFFPTEQLGFIRENHIDEAVDIRYFAPELNWMYEGYNADFDLTRYIPVYGTVVQFCIVFAIYMGFSEIVLLGCDNTGIVNCINALTDNIDEDNYSYEITEIEKKRMKSGAARNGLETEVRSYLKCIQGFRILNEYCDGRGIRLINCSKTTVIDSIKRMRLEDLFE